MMPGGTMEAWEIVKPIYTTIAAQVEGEACAATWVRDGAGHYVKMVHNGIEYGDMQLITEAYAILKDVLGMKPDELATIFEEWNKGKLDSFLIELTGRFSCARMTAATASTSWTRSSTRPARKARANGRS